MEQIAQIIDDRRAWEETPNGRQRLWCKDCRDQHQEWLTPEPCEHILQAKPEATINRELALEMLQLHRNADKIAEQIIPRSVIRVYDVEK